jgi:hypothetical protein
MSNATFWNWTLEGGDIQADRITINQDHVSSVVFGLQVPGRDDPVIQISMSNGTVVNFADNKNNRDDVDKRLRGI